MDRVSEKKVTAMVRALAWLEAHPDDSTGFTTTLATLRANVEKALAEHQRYVAGRQSFTEGVARRKKIRATISYRFMRAAAGLASRVEVTNPEAAKGLKPPPSAATNETWRAMAHSIAGEAKKHKAVLAAHGMPDSLGADLEQALVDYDQAVVAMNLGRREHVGARATLKAVLGDCMQLLRFFDGINLYRYPARPDLLAEWASARNLAWERGGREEGPEAAAAGK